MLFQDDDEKWIKFPNAEYMKGFKKKQRKPDEYPTPDECILDMINYQLKVGHSVFTVFYFHHVFFILLETKIVLVIQFDMYVSFIASECLYKYVKIMFINVL